jgi:metal-responsive CopG/Arc/MetJ family transcriptional regulator
MKTAISVPDPIFRAAEKLTKKLGVSRSRLYSQAVERYVQHFDDDAVTAKLNEVYSSESSTLEPALQSIQSRSVRKNQWK